MLTTDDVMAGKLVVQLGWASADEVRAELREVDRDPGAARDLINRLTDMGRLDEGQIQLLRHRTGLYEHVRAEAIYLRLLERHASISRDVVAQLIARLEQDAYRRRLGDVLVRKGKLTLEQDEALVRKQREFMRGEDDRILSRYRERDFEGVKRPLVPGAPDADPKAFSISNLFRSRETRALVDELSVQALRAEGLKARKTETAQQAQAVAKGQAAAASAPESGDLAAATPAVPVEDGEAQGTFARAPEDSGPPPPGSLSIGDVAAMKRIADYDVVEVLGTGGMGAVFLGQKEGAGEFCAIKVVLDRAANPLELGRFQREIELTRRLDHPNLIRVIDAGKTPEGLTYLVVPALAGRELRDLLEAAEGTGLEPQVVFRVFEQLLLGMQHCHERHIVHRDLKPENVFVLAGGQHEVKIMDFGLAKLGDTAIDEVNTFRTTVDDVCGSPAYISPEAVTNDPIDGRTDIYSLGIMLFEMLTGKLPLESETAQGFLGQHLICPPLTLTEARPDRTWSPDLEALLERMLAKTRDERPASCADVLTDLRGLEDALSASTLPPPGAAQPQPPSDPDIGEEWGFKGLLGRLWARGRE